MSTTISPEDCCEGMRVKSNHSTSAAFVGDYTKDSERPNSHKHDQKESYLYRDGETTYWTVSRIFTREVFHSG